MMERKEALHFLESTKYTQCGVKKKILKRVLFYSKRCDMQQSCTDSSDSTHFFFPLKLKTEPKHCGCLQLGCSLKTQSVLVSTAMINAQLLPIP